MSASSTYLIMPAICIHLKHDAFYCLKINQDVNNNVIVS